MVLSALEERHNVEWIMFYWVPDVPYLKQFFHIPRPKQGFIFVVRNAKLSCLHFFFKIILNNIQDNVVLKKALLSIYTNGMSANYFQ